MRPVAGADIPRIVEMGRAFHAKFEMPGEFHPDVFAQSCRAWLGFGAGFISAGGAILGIAIPRPYDMGEILAIETFWWAEDGSGAALAGAFEDWAAGAGASRVWLSLPRGGAAQRRLMRTMGYSPDEVAFRKDIPCRV